jgi:chemotaxis signal transduction protein
VPDRDPSQGQAQQYLSFMVAGAEYGVPILKVKEILQYEEPTRVPGTPASIRGVLNVRGAAVPVVDLGVRFGKGESAPTKRTCVLVLDTEAAAGRALAVVADAVNEVVDLRSEDVEPPPDFGAGVRLDYLVGVGKVGKRFALLVDIDRVLTAPDVGSADAAVLPAPEAEPGLPAEPAPATPPANPA